MIDSLNLYLEGNKFSPSVLRKMDVTFIYVDFQFTFASVLNGDPKSRDLFFIRRFVCIMAGKFSTWRFFSTNHMAQLQRVYIGNLGTLHGIQSWRTYRKMLHKLMWENVYLFYHWICIFLVFTPTVVQTLSKCSKVDVCKCSTDEGTIDLWSLDGTGSNIPRFDYDLDLWPVNISRLGPKEISHLDNRALKKKRKSW